MHFRLSLLGLILISTTGLPAQQPAPDRTHPVQVFRTSADLVTIDAVVTDGDGRHVTDLTATDFEVTVAGKKQELQQAVYVKTADQPRVLAAARATASPAETSGASAASAPSEASLALRKTGVQPDHIARTIALVVDDLGLSFESTFYVRKALHTYVDTQMQPGDLVAIVRTAGGVGALQQFTTDKRLLHMAAERVQWDFRSRNAVGWLRPVTTDTGVGDVDDSAAADLRDAMASSGSLGALEFIARGVAELPGRKCIVFMSEGFVGMFKDRAESGRIWRSMSRMLGRANAAGVVVYTVNAGGLQTGGLTAEDNPQQIQTGIQGTYDAEATVRDRANTRFRSLFDAQESLQFIADQTGGLAVANTNDLNLGISRVLDDQQGYYLLGYVASKDAPRRGWDQNRVKVRLKRRPGLHVRARQGFFGPSDPTEPKGFGYDTLTTAALSPFASGAITARLTSMFGHDGKHGAYVRSLLFIDTSDLRFDEDQPGRHTATFQVNLLALGDNGVVLAEWRRLVPVALNDAQFQLARERGIVYSVRTRIKKPGGYQMRAAVRDVNTNLTGSASQFIEVPKVGSGKLALSGVLLKGLAEAATVDGTVRDAAAEGLAEAVLLEPEVRVLEPGTDAVYAYEIYDGLKPEDAGHLQMATALLREGKVVYQSPFSPVTATPRAGKKLRAIPIAGKLALGKDMPAGPYTLEVIVRGKDGRKLERKQWLDFEIRR
jgi:VWFA-related protein